MILLLTKSLKKN